MDYTGERVKRINGLTLRLREHFKPKRGAPPILKIDASSSYAGQRRQRALGAAC